METWDISAWRDGQRREHHELIREPSQRNATNGRIVLDAGHQRFGAWLTNGRIQRAPNRVRELCPQPRTASVVPIDRLEQLDVGRRVESDRLGHPADSRCSAFDRTVSQSIASSAPDRTRATRRRISSAHSSRSSASVASSAGRRLASNSATTSARSPSESPSAWSSTDRTESVTAQRYPTPNAVRSQTVSIANSRLVESPGGRRLRTTNRTPSATTTNPIPRTHDNRSVEVWSEIAKTASSTARPGPLVAGSAREPNYGSL